MQAASSLIIMAASTSTHVYDFGQEWSWPKEAKTT
jgi:hypothetical protein